MKTNEVVALYVDPKGPYPSLVEEWYDEARDARTYSGNKPVIAHPPCGPWGSLKHLYLGNEHDCAPRAVEQVRSFGGVLEHPAGSKLWPHCNLPTPGHVDSYGGWCIEVEQVSWGHVARKRTWLYFIGVESSSVLSTLRTGGTPTHWVGGGRGNNPKRRGPPIPPGIKACSSQQKRRTPPLFAEWLVWLARASRVAAERVA